MNQAFLAACRAVLPDEESVTKRVKLVVSSSSAAVGSTLDGTASSSLSVAAVKPIGWRCVGLSYSVPWPLHLVITDRALEEYNRVFRFLLTVRRTQMSLHRVWAQETTGRRRHRSRRLAPTADADLRLRLQRLRLHMTLVVDNLQQYFVADVLGSQFSRLDARVAASVDFEDLR